MDLPTRPTADRWRWLCVGVGIVLRVIPWTRNPPVWQDEAALVLNVIHLDFAQFFGPLIHHQAAPPLFLGLERLTFLLIGDSEWALRLPILLLGCLSLVLFASLARRLVADRATWSSTGPAEPEAQREGDAGRSRAASPSRCASGSAGWPAAIAVGLFAVSDRLIWHATEVKPYAIDALVAVLVAWGYVRTRHWSLTRQCGLWLVVLPVLVWLSYPTCFVAGGLLLGLLPEAIRGSWSSRFMYAAAGVAIAGSFAALALGPAHAHRDEALSDYWVAQLADWHHPARVPVWMLAQTSEVDRYSLMPLGQALIPFALIGAIRMGRSDGRLLTVLLAPAGLTLLAALLGKYPYGGGRVNVFLAPAYILLVAGGVPPVWDWLWRNAKPAVIGVVALLALPVGQAVFRTAVPWVRPDFRTPIAFVNETAPPDDAISGDHWELLYYTRREPDRYFPLAEIARRRPNRVWVITGTDPGVPESVLGQVPADWHVIETWTFDGTIAVLMERRP
jgi:hypothetical protein